uniref:Cytochrome P450 n=1 Tax=uncultured bacterium BAC-AB1442/1414/561 TaxID=1562172 RepID=A0A0C4S570_9BACT|nr:cytochrome P450 [uncultured bacterium BAC-AB1442/1414/561]
MVAPPVQELTDGAIGSYLLAARGRQWIAGATDGRDPWSLILRGGDREALVRRARDRGAVYHSPAGCWVVTEPAPAAEILADPRMGLWYADRALGAMPPDEVERPLLAHFLSLHRAFMCADQAEYRRLPAWTEPVLGPGTADHRAVRLTATCRTVLSALPDHFDLVRDFARPCATAVLAELTGLGAAERVRLAEASAACAPALDAVVCPPQRPVALGLRAGVEQLRALFDAEGGGAAAWARVLTAVAGVEMAAQLTVDVVLALIADPRRRTAGMEPAGVRGLVEEVLRRNPPVRVEHRVAQADVTVAGQLVTAGSEVVVLIDAANLDGGPDRRPLTVDDGLYTACVAPFARATAEAAVTATLSLPVTWALAGDPVRRLRSPVTAAYAGVPIAAVPGAARRG